MAESEIEQMVPEEVFEYLKEGNSKEDLIEWIWRLIPEEEKTEIINEAKQALEDYEGYEGDGGSNV